jgi:ABC-2 type transport system ATP-binding protein
MSAAFLYARGLQKSFGKQIALKSVDLTVEKGELFGLLGPNGAGKTTTISILTGLRDADAGTVLLEGEALHRGRRDLRRRIGLGTQDLAVYPDLTARENLAFFGKIYDLQGPTLTERIEELLDAVGLKDRADHRAGTFSGGMKRRLNLAVAVIHSPDVLFLDEPTTGVDPQSRNHIFELVKSLNAAGMTIIYTSHYMEEVQALCKRLAIIDHGEVKACDTVASLLKRLTAKLTLEGVTAVEEFTRLSGVRGIETIDGKLVINAEAIAPILPAIASICATHGMTPIAMHVQEPSLESVFLHLTGRGLRD